MILETAGLPPQDFDTAEPLRIYAGILGQIGDIVMFSATLRRLKALFPNPEHTLWPGQYVNVRLAIGTRRDATTVPESAVQRGPEGLIAYLVKPDGSVATQTVRVAQMQDGKAIIEQGLQPGERVIVDGQSRVRSGVKVVEAKEPGRMPQVAQKNDKR